jgi:hypothetical protein
MKKSLVFLVYLLTGVVTFGQDQPVNHWETDWLSLAFISYNLPFVIITTPANQTIMDEPKIEADMKIIYHGSSSRNLVSDSGSVYTGKIGIEIRGHYSTTLPQKSYGIETCDSAGNNLNVSLLGMPEENDWVLIPNYNDKAFLRNVLAFDISHKMG